MLEKLKQEVYDANMRLPKLDLVTLLGAMFPELTEKKAYSLSSHPVSITMI